MDYKEQALNFLKETNTDFEIDFVKTVEGFPFDNDYDKKLLHNAYKFKLIHNGKTYENMFYDSYHNYLHNIEPVAYDVLASLMKYDVGEMSDFVDEYGYVIKDRNSFKTAERAWIACKNEYRALKEMFDSNEMKMLQEIS